MKKKNVVIMYQLIEEILKVSKKSVLNWKLIQNKNILKPIKEEIDEFIKPSEEYTIFEKKRIELCSKYATKDEDGSPKMKVKYVNSVPSQIFDGLDDNKEFNKEVEDLKEEYKETIKEREDQVKHYDDVIMNEEVKIENKFKKIAVGIIPDDILTGDLFEYLEPILED